MRSLGRGIIREGSHRSGACQGERVRAAGSAALRSPWCRRLHLAIDDCGASADQEGIAGDLPEAEFLLTAAPII